MKNNLNHWYDGKFYDKFIAPNQDVIFEKIKRIIPTGSSVLDFGCGTGRLPLFLSDKCKSVTGIDLSLKNIEAAEINLQKANINNVNFIHGSADYIVNEKSYDFVTMSFVIHEIPQEARINILKKLKEAASKLIIADYSINRTFTNRIFNELVEFFAGSEHYKNYKSYLRFGGLESLLKASDYEFELIEHGIGFSSDIYRANSIENI